MFQYGIKFKNDPEFIKDCIQDVFFKLIKAGKNLGTTNNIRFYLFKSMKTSILKKIEKDRRLEEIGNDLKFEAQFSVEEEIAEKENATEKEKSLSQALKKLSDRQREIIYLRYECEMEYSQICEIMHLKNDSARRLVFRAIKTLREIIDDEIKFPVLFFFRFSAKYAL
jgi:RNA polymerase sigma factor (sigma-70 family)